MNDDIARADAPFRFTIGSLNVHILNDGVFRLDGGGLFGRVPKVLWEKVVTPDHLNRAPLSMNSMLFEENGKLILMETGYGDKLSAKEYEAFGLTRPQGSLLDQLAKIGVKPEDIDIVINTHLHGDHAGWNTRFKDGDPAAGIVPTFPNAVYITQKLEWEHAAHPTELTAPGYPSNNFHVLKETGVLHLIEGETRISPAILLTPTPGHTIGHQSVWVESGMASALFTGDAAVMGVHLERLNWVSGVDNFPIQSVETKRVLVEEALKRQASVVVTHHPFPGLGILRREEGQRRAVFQEITEQS